MAIPSQYAYIEHLNDLFVKGWEGQPNVTFYDSYTYRQGAYPYTQHYINRPVSECTIVSPNLVGIDYDNHKIDEVNPNGGLKTIALYPRVRIDVTYTDPEEPPTVTYSESDYVNLFTDYSDYRYNWNYGSLGAPYGTDMVVGNASASMDLSKYNTTVFGNLNNCIEFIYHYYSNADLYVNGEKITELVV